MTGGGRQGAAKTECTPGITAGIDVEEAIRREMGQVWRIPAVPKGAMGWRMDIPSACILAQASEEGCSPGDIIKAGIAGGILLGFEYNSVSH